MAAIWTTVPVFISSTFTDMHAERDHLVRFVLPRLREVLLKRHIHLVDVDLRWGVTSDQDALQVCRSVIDECRPRFLCMLGGRYGWIPPGRQHSITADEIEYGLAKSHANDSCTLFYFRDPNVTAQMVEAKPGEFRELAGSEKEANLRKLKASILRANFHPYVYSGKWDPAANRLVDLQAFGERVYRDLLASIDAEFGQRAEEAADEYEQENAATEALLAERTQHWVLGSRQLVWNELSRHQSAGGGNLLCVVGEPGSGKTALLAKFFAERGAQDSDHLIIAHFVGLGAGFSGVVGMLHRLCQSIYRQGTLAAHKARRLDDIDRNKVSALAKVSGTQQDVAQQRQAIEAHAFARMQEVEAEYAPAADPAELRLQFERFLTFAAESQPVLLLVDALNQLDDVGILTPTNWLPVALPPNVSIIVTTLSGPTLDHLRSRHAPPKVCLLPLLTADDSASIIEQTLSRFHKSLTAGQRSALLAKRDAGKPLYLLAALEELRTLGTYEEITSRIQAMPETITSVFEWILARLEEDPGFRDGEGRPCGRALVSRFAQYLCASRHGLSQKELIQLLVPGDPQGNVAALLQLLRPYLMRRGELLDFYHGQFREAARGRYLATDENNLSAHRGLAVHFRHVADPQLNGSWSGAEMRAFQELPYHLVQAADQQLPALLLDFQWLHAKASKALIYDSIQDFQAALAIISPGETAHAALKLVCGALELSAGVVATDSNQLGSQLLGRLADHMHPLIARLLGAAERWRGKCWLLPDEPKLMPPGTALLRRVQAHRGCFDGMAVTHDKRRLITADDDIKIWDTNTGMLLQTLNGIGSRIHQLLISPDDNWAISAADNGSVHVWNITSGKLAHTLVPGVPGYDSTLTNFRVALVLQGEAVAACTQYGAIKIWNIRTAQEIHTVRAAQVEDKASPLNQGRTSPSHDAATDTTSSFALSSDVDDEFELDLDLSLDDSGILTAPEDGFVFDDWETPALDDDDEPVRLLEEDEEKEPACPRPDLVSSQDGSRLCALADKELWIWELQAAPRNAQGQKIELVDSISSADTLLLSSDGQFAVVKCGISEHGDLNDHTIFNLATGKRYLLQGADFTTGRFAVSPNNRRLFGIAGNRLTEWSLDTGKVIRKLPGDEVVAGSLLLTENGKRLIATGGANAISVWSLEGQNEPKRFPSPNFTSNDLVVISSATGGSALLTADEHVLITQSADGALEWWDLDGAPALANSAAVAKTIKAIAYAENGSVVLSTSGDQVAIWGCSEGPAKRRNQHLLHVPASSLAVSADGKVAMVAKKCNHDEDEAEEAVSLHEFALDDEAESLDLSTESESWLQTITSVWNDFRESIGPTIRKLLPVQKRNRKKKPKKNDNKLLTVYDVPSGKQKLSFGQNECSYSFDEPLVATSSNGQLAITSDESRLQGWDTRTGRKVCTLGPVKRAYEHPAMPGDEFSLVADDPNAHCKSLTLSSDGNTAISGMDEGTLRIWDVRRQRQVRELEAGEGEVSAVAITPDARRAASICDNQLVVWDLHSGAPLFGRILQSYGERLAISQDGRQVIFSEGRSISLWELEPVENLASFTSDAEITACALSPLGDCVVVGNKAGRLHFLHLITPETKAANVRRSTID